MDKIKNPVWDASLKRIAEIFNVPVETLRPEFRFHEDLKNTFVSNFKRNEYDIILDDIHDVADGDTIKEIAKGRFVVNTVADYCDLMVKSFASQPKIVKEVLRL